MKTYKCDFLCLQELWLLDETLYRLGSISTEYMYTAISGVDSRKQILQGRPHGGVAIMYKKSLAKYVTHVRSENRRVCAVKITTDDNFTCLIISVYLPCDTYNQRVQKKYVDTFDYIECIISSIECDSVIICGDYNTSFERESGQVDYLNDFISRSNMKISWDNDKAMKDFTYTNYSLGHKSCIDHIIMSGVYLME